MAPLANPFKHYSKWLTKKAPTKTTPAHGSGKSKNPSPTKSPKDRFQELFWRLDSDGDGLISSEELRSFLRWSDDLALPEESAIVLCDADVDGGGYMDYRGFIRLVDGGRRQGGEDYNEDIRRAFAIFEGEDCGITPNGLRRVLGMLGEEKTPEECANMISVYDLDGNGVLDYHEFHRMMD